MLDVAPRQAVYGAMLDAAGLNFYDADPNLAFGLRLRLGEEWTAQAERALREAGEVAGGESDIFGPTVHEEERDLRAEDEALVAAALEAERETPAEADSSEAATEPGGREDGDDGQPRRRRRGRRGGRGRAGARRGGARGGKLLEGTFDHGDEGYGLWLDPAVRDDPVYAEHWAGHRPVTVAVEADRIVITRAGENADAADDEPDRDGDEAT